jgi:hypothetical protein
MIDDRCECKTNVKYAMSDEGGGGAPSMDGDWRSGLKG